MWKVENNEVFYGPQLICVGMLAQDALNKIHVVWKDHAYSMYSADELIELAKIMKEVENPTQRKHRPELGPMTKQLKTIPSGTWIQYGKYKDDYPSRYGIVKQHCHLKTTVAERTNEYDSRIHDFTVLDGERWVIALPGKPEHFEV